MLGGTPSDCLFVCEVFQLLILTDWAHNVLKEVYLSLFYLTKKALFMRVVSSAQCKDIGNAFQQKHFYHSACLDDSQDPHWKPVPHTSVFVPTLARISQTFFTSSLLPM